MQDLDQPGSRPKSARCTGMLVTGGVAHPGMMLGLFQTALRYSGRGRTASRQRTAISRLFGVGWVMKAERVLRKGAMYDCCLLSGSALHDSV